MLSRFKKHREAAQISKALAGAQNALCRLGELIERYPNGYIDESWLPLPRQNMKVALKLLWLAAKDDEQRGLAETGWFLLSFFLPNIGNIPISPDLPSEDTSQQELEQKLLKLGPYIEFGKLWKAEMLADRAEFAEFVKNPQI